MNFKKRIISLALVCSIAVPQLTQFKVAADETEKYQYTMFGRNGITMSVSSNLCMNGNLHTNKDAAITATNKNINGKLTTSADIEKRVKHVYADQKIYDTYFTTNCELHEEEYVYSDMNIHINNPLYCYSNITLDGNVSLNSSIGTLMDINVTGEVKNANNSVVYSKYGNITIENDSVANVNGLIYAPLGTVTINASNVNLNGVIIADQVVINGSSVNINCNDSIARFIGETSEEYDFSGLEYLPEEWLGDTDADALFDIYEKVIDSDPFNPDTDGDGLPDGYEVLTLNTDPLEIDTDGNGVLDGNEDFDADNLVNIDEYHNQTLPFTPDTDEDGFVDGDEVHIYGTIPTNSDTDGDKLLDGEESYDGSIYLEYGVYFDPLNPDTDGDGISDGDEVFGQTKEQEVQTQDEAITEVIVDMETNGNIDRTLTVESMQGIDAMTSNVYALVGEPFNFETESDFESATITFKIDQSKLGDTKFDKLLILWYNEAEKTFVEMETAHDAANSTVSTTTTHFSQYMVVDSEKWINNWNDSINALRKMWSGNTSYTRNLHTFYLIDCSSNMEEDDEISYSIEIGYNGVTEENYQKIISDMDNPSDVEYYEKNFGRRICKRTTICENIISNKWANDYGRVITFSDIIESSSGYINSASDLKQQLQNVNNDGGTAYLDQALDLALGYVNAESDDWYRIIVITNDEVEFGTISSDEFSDNVFFNIINLGSSEIGRNIDAVAQATGGDVYNAISADVLTTQVGEVVTTPWQFDGVDSDGDTIPDDVEEFGLQPNGEPIGTDKNLTDSDGDGIDDNIELGYVPFDAVINVSAEYLSHFSYESNPAKIDSDDDGITDDEELIISTSLLNADTDGDGLNDSIEYTQWYDPLDPNPDGDSYNDYQEYYNETDPYNYDLTAEEWATEFKNGVLQGDFIEDPSVPELLGQIAGGIAPVVGTIADIRDTIANISQGHWLTAIFSASGVAPAAGDAIKASSNIINFITRNMDKTDEISELIIALSKNFPDDFAKLVPNSSLDEIIAAFKQNNTMSHKTYDEIVAILKKAGKKLPTIADDFPDAKKVIANTDVWGEIPTKRGFAIDELLGNNLGRTYETYDKYDDLSNIATSIKSIDPMCNSYKTASGFRGILRKHARDLIEGKDYVTLGDETYQNVIKQLELAFPDAPLTNVQKQVLDEFVQEYSDVFDIVITIVE